MSLFDFFSKKSKEQTQEKKETPEAAELDIYSGMRVEVTTFQGHLLFVAKLLGLHGNKAELHQYSEMDLPQSEEPRRVRIRGYSDKHRKAVYMEGTISPLPKGVWQVDELSVGRIGNDRAFFRLDTNLNATATSFSGLAMGEKPCIMLNISVGGACVKSEYQYHEGDKFLLKVKLMEDRPESVMFCQVLRVVEKGEHTYEYGCQFLELTEDDQSKIVQNIFAVQRQKRASS